LARLVFACDPVCEVTMGPSIQQKESVGYYWGKCM